MGEKTCRIRGMRRVGGGTMKPSPSPILPQFSPVKQRQNNGRHGNYRRNALGRNNSV